MQRIPREQTFVASCSILRYAAAKTMQCDVRRHVAQQHNASGASTSLMEMVQDKDIVAMED